MADPGEGPSDYKQRVRRNLPYHERLSLVRDIETIDSDAYIPTQRPLTSSSFDSTKPNLGTRSVSMSSKGSQTKRPSMTTFSQRNQRSGSVSISSQNGGERDMEPDQIGHISLMRPDFNRSTSTYSNRSSGVISSSSRHSIDTESGLPPPIPITRERLREHNLQPLDRTESVHTVSSYAMYTPRTPSVAIPTPSVASKQVRFDENMEHEITGEQPPLPPHAALALAEARRQQALFFHGPPPLHGDDVLPPPYKGNTSGTNNMEEDELSFNNNEKATLNHGEPPSWWRARRKRLWLLIIIGIIAIIVGVVTGVVVGVVKHKSNKQTGTPANATTTDFPSPSGFMGSWSFTTNLTETEDACSPAPSNASTPLWRCYPYSTNSQPVVWSFVISSTDGDSSDSDNVQLSIQSTTNPFTLNFPAEPLNLTRTITNAYYGFNFTYTKTTIIAFGDTVAECEFPNSFFSGQLFVNNTIFSTTNSEFGVSKHVDTDNRGEWPGSVVLQEEKYAGSRQILCRDRQTQDVLDLGAITADHGDGNCLCAYNNL